MSEEKIEKIEKLDKLGKSSKMGMDPLQVPEEIERLAPNKEHFDALIKPQDIPKATDTTAKIEPVSKTSLMDEVRNLNQKVSNFDRVSPTQLVAQADEVVSKIETIKRKLASPDLKLQPQTQTLLQDKLLHIDENLRVALSKAGLEYTPAQNLENKSVNPIDRFLGFLTNGQNQLASLSGEVERMHLNNKEISPANMLRIQMKVGYITQEIEFFTAVLNKALDSTKTIMNVQV